MRKISHILFTAIIMLTVISTSRAQDDKAIAPITKSGSAAFMFSLSGLGIFNSSGPGAAIVDEEAYTFHTGAKMYLADMLALRVLLSLSMQDNGNSDFPEKYSEIGIGAGIEHHLSPIASVSPYIGAQIIFLTSSLTMQAQPDNANSSQVPQETGTEVSGTGFQVAALAGFDWFPWRGIALGAEYILGYQTSSGTQKDLSTGTETDAPSPNALGIDGGVNIHAVIYF